MQSHRDSAEDQHGRRTKPRWRQMDRVTGALRRGRRAYPIKIRVMGQFASLVAVQVSTVAVAKSALDAGCDLLICQGIEAGGHVQSTVRRLAIKYEHVISNGARSERDV